jgi:serine/threonine protein kinase
VVPKSVGTYRILRKIGEGGMGDVYEGFDDRIQRHAAIKLLHPQYATNARMVERLHSEATAVNIIRHPSVVQIDDFGRLKDGTTYLVMEYLEGETLADRLQMRATPMSEAEVLPIAAQLASALDAAHQHGIVHRDIKPGNVMLIPDEAVLDGERVKLLDFGIAKLAEGLFAQQPTQAGTIMGSPSYLAPEQCRGERDIDGKADVYALGVLLYHLFASRPPFVGSTPMDLISKHLVELPPPLAALAPGLSKSIVELVHRMLRKEKEQRPTMSAVLAVLKQMRKSQWSAHRAEPPPILSVPEELIGIRSPPTAQPPPLNFGSPREFFSSPTKVLEQITLPPRRLARDIPSAGAEEKRLAAQRWGPHGGPGPGWRHLVVALLSDPSKKSRIPGSAGHSSATPSASFSAGCAAAKGDRGRRADACPEAGARDAAEDRDRDRGTCARLSGEPTGGLPAQER